MFLSLESGLSASVLIMIKSLLVFIGQKKQGAEFVHRKVMILREQTQTSDIYYSRYWHL
jgi:hypothetical protein